MWLQKEITRTKNRSSKNRGERETGHNDILQKVKFMDYKEPKNGWKECRRW